MSVYRTIGPLVDEWTLPSLSFEGVFRVIRSDFKFLFRSSMKFLVSKQNSPRCDAAFCGVASGAILFAYAQ